MANNPKSYINDSVLLVDPNPEGNGLVSSEDLNIIVELETINKPRSAINVIGGNSTQVIENNPENIKINFINGTDINGKQSLTTHYTELNTAYGDTHSDLETLGITSIDIDFNTSYAPIVKINFTDIRAQLFEKGNSSPYNVFFTLPYPIFKLKVKGYYGKSVSYCLHLVNFNSEFDSNTGNFNIVGEFIGYTYALLSDMLMGYLRAIPETSFGSKIIDEYNTQSGKPFIKINELIERVQNFNSEVGNLKQSDKSVKELAKYEDIKINLNEFKSNILLSFEDISEGSGIFTNTGYCVIKQPTTRNEINILNGKVSVLNDILKGTIVEFNNGTPNNLRLSIEDFKIDRYENVKLSNFNGDYYVGNTNTSLINDSKKSKEVSDILRNKLPNAENQNFLILDISNGINVVTEYVKKIDTNVEITRNDISYEIENKITETLKIEPGVKNFIEIFTNHVELLLDSIKIVSYIAESNLDARRRLVNDRTEFSDISEDSQIFAFPEYTKQSDANGAVEDAWLGNDFSEDVFPEIKLVNELLEGLLTSKDRDDDLLTSLINLEETWYPVNPMDSSVFTKTNPWSKVSDGTSVDVLRLMLLRATTFISYTNNELNNDEITQMAKLEATNAYNSISNKLIKNSINYYNGYDTNSITTLIMNQAINRDVSGVNVTRRSAPSFDSPIFQNSDINNNDGGIFKLFKSSTGYVDIGDPDVNAYYEYVYISGDGEFENVEDSDYNRKYFLPVSENFDGEDLINTTNVERKELRENGKVFFSSYVGPNSEDENERVDDGATYIKIIDVKTYSSNLSNLPKYGDDLIKNTRNYGKFGAKEFLAYQSSVNVLGNDILPNWLQFYDNFDNANSNDKKIFSFRNDDENSDKPVSSKFDIPLNGEGRITNATHFDFKTLSRLRYSNHRELLLDSSVNGKMFNTPFVNIHTGDIQYTSLFGSFFYNMQRSDEAKAFLYLHSLPFNGMSEVGSVNFIRKKGLFKEDSIKELFNKNGGFINVPKSWLLFLGGLIWRMKSTSDPILFTTRFGTTDYSLFPGIEFDDLETPRQDQYITVLDSVKNAKNFTVKFRGANDYVDIEPIIKKLPNQVKDELINEFLTWVKSQEGFIKIKENAEIFVENTANSDIVNFWLNFDETDVISNLNNVNLKPEVINNYKIVGKDNYIASIKEVSSSDNVYTRLDEEGVSYLPFNFFLEIRDNSLLNKNINDFLIEEKILVNTTWRIWNDSQDDFLGLSTVEEQSLPFRVLESKMGTYTKAFIDHFNKLNSDYKAGKEKEDELKQSLFKTINNDDIKISIYKNLKSIYDKWVCGAENALFFCGTNDENEDYRLIDSFRFIDRAYNDIGDVFKLNPLDLVDLVQNNYNQSFYDYIGTILRDNNFDFIPLPTFINYNSKDDIESVFKTYDYSEDVTQSGPQFICMYIGERSNKLDLDDNKLVNDSFEFVTSNGDISNPPVDFTSGETTPVFLVNYSTQNQSIFKNLKLNQKEFTETNESLWITDKISQRGSPTNRTGIGQNLYPVYLTRAYTCNIEAMGNAQIQPFMYFQLNNVPMFKGAYTIIHVSHKIVPNSMTTSFKGVRIKHSKTRFVKDDSIYMNLIGSLNDVDIDNFELSSESLSKKPKQVVKKIIEIGESSEYSPFVDTLIEEKPWIKYQAPEIRTTAYVIKEINQILEQAAFEFNQLASSKSYGEVIYINDFSRQYGGKYDGHASHDKGLSGDIRPIIIDKSNKRTNIFESNYSREGTREFIKTLIKVSNSFNVPVEKIFFNDTTLSSEFNNLVRKPSANDTLHNNHLHVVWTVPERVSLAIENGDRNPTSGFDVQPLEKIALNQRPSEEDKLNAIGQI